MAGRAERRHRLNGLSAEAEFFQQSVDRFEDTATGPAYRVTVGGRTVVLRFASDHLAHQLAPSFQAVNDSDPAHEGACDLTIYAADANTLRLPRPSWSWDSYSSRGEIGNLRDGPFRAVYLFGVPTFSMLDRTGSRAIFWADTQETLPHFIVSSPFLHILHWWLCDHGIQLVHGAAVGANGRAIVAVGRGGSGKTTTALACALVGMDYLADDYCAVDCTNALVFPVYASGKIFPADAARLPGIEEFIREDVRAGEKVVLDMRTMAASGSREITAVVTPMISDKVDSTFRAATPGAALTALAPSTMMQLGFADGGALREMSTLVRSVRSIRLDVGTDASRIPDAVRAMIGA